MRPGRIHWAERVLRRIVVRTSQGPARLIWAAAYALALRGVGRLALRGARGASVYARGSLGAGRPAYGHSDLDVAVVVRDDAEAVRVRWAQLASRWGLLRRAVDMAVYDEGSLGRIVRAPGLVAPGARHLGDAAPRDDADLLVRPGLGAPLRDWRRVHGPHRKPGVPEPSGLDRLPVAWLELQFVWRYAFDACRYPAEPHVPHVCVKLVADPARVWLWLTGGELLDGRRTVLERALGSLPEERDTLAETLCAHDALARGGAADLGLGLRGLLAMSRVIERHVAQTVAHVPWTTVALDGAEEPRLALPAGAADALRGLSAGEPQLRPLCDWRARAWPLPPDEAFAPSDLDASDPGDMARALHAASSYGPYAALRRGDLLILPGPGILRAIQSPATDPVSFALASGRTEARFPEVAGWSARDCARRAVEEHRAGLAANAGGRSRRETLGLLLSAARAGQFLESVDAGAPRLPVTLDAAAGSIDSRGSPGLAECAEHYRDARLAAAEPPESTLRAARAAVMALPSYGGLQPRAAAP